ncbi:MAG: HAD-IB family hydrolase [Pseudomonadota bacterium]
MSVDTVAHLDDAPGGAGTTAFFDLDGTLVAGFTVASFMFERLREGGASPRQALGQITSLLGTRLNGSSYDTLIHKGAEAIIGESERDFERLGEKVFRRHTAATIFPESRTLIRRHQELGHRVAIVTSATRYQVEPIARELGVENIFCNRFAVANGKFTGDIEGPIVYGKGKVEAAQRFLAETGGELSDAYFYSDGAEDIPLLEAVGQPYPTNPDNDLTRHAEAKRWPIQRFDSRGFPGAKEFLRTGLSYGSFIGAALSIAPTWFLNRSKREAVNLATTIWGEVGSSLSGIKLDIHGEEHVWSQRPAVFVFNHQSVTDALIVARLLRRDFTGIAKKELAMHPLAGPLFRIADTVFVDRQNAEKAIRSLKSVTHTLHKGISIAVAPEGTRSVGDKLGAFKKGPFHIAREAGVPMVPIVIHNSTDVLPKGGIFLHPARVRVDVLPPIDTSAWRAKDVDAHVEQVRDLFLETLGQSDD